MESVNDALKPLQRLILSYSTRIDRPRYAFLFAFDSRLAEIIRTTSEPLIGQMRLTWWRDILTKPEEERPEGEPLVAIFNALQCDDQALEHLLRLIDGWEVMLEDFPWDDRQVETYASSRGTGYFGFGLASHTISEDISRAAELWALWDFALHCSDIGMRTASFARSQKIATETMDPDFDKSGRPLSILYKLALHDVRNEQLSETLYRPSTAARIIWHGITGK